MAISLDGVLEGRGECPVHLQLEVDEVLPPSNWPGSAELRGRVVRVFRGELALGMPLAVNLSVTRSGAPIPPGDFFYEWDTVREARYLEVFLQRNGDTLRVPTNSCTEVIDAPSDVPLLEWARSARPRIQRPHSSAAKRRWPWLVRLLRRLGLR